jgi:hypothetical protein
MLGPIAKTTLEVSAAVYCLCWISASHYPALAAELRMRSGSERYTHAPLNQQPRVSREARSALEPGNHPHLHLHTHHCSEFQPERDCEN